MINKNKRIFWGLPDIIQLYSKNVIKNDIFYQGRVYKIHNLCARLNYKISLFF